ncbi:MAG: nucleotidyltransferase domain-containing protein [Synechococcus sp.]
MMRQVTVEIREEIPEAGVRLFGSRARGDATPSTDVDLLLHSNSKVEELHQGSFWMARSYAQAMHHVARRECGQHGFWRVGEADEARWEYQKQGGLATTLLPVMRLNASRTGLRPCRRPSTGSSACCLTDGHKSEILCAAVGLSSLGGQGAVRAWGSHTSPIPRGFPRPAPW